VLVPLKDSVGAGLWQAVITRVRPRAMRRTCKRLNVPPSEVRYRRSASEQRGKIFLGVLRDSHYPRASAVGPERWHSGTNVAQHALRAEVRALPPSRRADMSMEGPRVISPATLLRKFP